MFRLVFLNAVGLPALILSISAVGAGSPASRPATQPSTEVPAPAGWKLAWHDEFNGDAIDRTKWNFDEGNRLPNGPPGWGNNELEFYTARPDNAFVRDGALHVRAIREDYQGCRYTSARLKTRNLFGKAYGRFEFRAKLPTGKGLWPALWLLPQDEKFGGWAASGEIDIMEARGQEPTTVLGTLHYGSRWPANTYVGKDYKLPENGTIADFHVYALEWVPGEIRWYEDDHLYQTQDFWWSCSKSEGSKGAKPLNESDLNAWPAPFNQPFYIVMNLAVGGQFLGNPDDKTPFPAEMVVEYVRVYDRIEGYPAIKPRGPGKLPFPPH